MNKLHLVYLFNVFEKITFQWVNVHRTCPIIWFAITGCTADWIPCLVQDQSPTCLTTTTCFGIAEWFLLMCMIRKNDPTLLFLIILFETLKKISYPFCIKIPVTDKNCKWQLCLVSDSSNPSHQMSDLRIQIPS